VWFVIHANFEISVSTVYEDINFSVLVKRLAGKIVCKMTYFVPIETLLNLNSFNQRTYYLKAT